jgi:hypothetical protein
MPTTNIYFEPISKPNLDLDDLAYEPYDDPTIDFGNPLRHPKHGSHESHKSDQEEQRQRLEYIENLGPVASN